MDKHILRRRVPSEFLDLDRIKHLIKESDHKIYKIAIKLNMNYRPFLRRLDGEVRFSVQELIHLANVLETHPDELCKECDLDDIIDMIT